MDNFELRLTNILAFKDLAGNDSFDGDKVEELEAIIDECIVRHRGNQVNAVADSIYDVLIEMLREANPNSRILMENWEGEGDISEYTDLLVNNPMMSILTIKNINSKDMYTWIDELPDSVGLLASYKINGHGIRVVYKDGYLVSATSRARASAGRDLTRHCQIMLGEYKEELSEYGLVELRGEVCLRVDKLDLARQYTPGLKSAFSAVSSLIKPSATEEEIQLLDFLCYGFLCEGFEFETKEEEYQHIVSVGFDTPEYMLIESVQKDELSGEYLMNIVESFEENYEEFGYFCDGVVLEVNERDVFRELGVEANHNRGNVALKVGLWKQDAYCGVVQKIEWTKGKSKLSPVAIIADAPDLIQEDMYGNVLNMEAMGVITAQGNSVKRVPLYEPKNIWILDAYIGRNLYFRYGGEAGVVPCFPDGRTLSEDAAINILEG